MTNWPGLHGGGGGRDRSGRAGALHRRLLPQPRDLPEAASAARRPLAPRQAAAAQGRPGPQGLRAHLQGDRDHAAAGQRVHEARAQPRPPQHPRAAPPRPPAREHVGPPREARRRRPGARLLRRHRPLLRPLGRPPAQVTGSHTYDSTSDRDLECLSNGREFETETKLITSYFYFYYLFIYKLIIVPYGNETRVSAGPLKAPAIVVCVKLTLLYREH